MAARGTYGGVLLFSHPEFVAYFGRDHVQHVPVTVIDQSGALIIRLYRSHIFENTEGHPKQFLRADGLTIDGTVIAEFQVSAPMMIQSCATFEEICQSNNWSADHDICYIDLESYDSLPMEIFLRVLHNSESLNEQLSSIKLSNVQDVVNIIQAFKCPKSRFRHWFFEWLGSKDDICSINPLDTACLESLQSLCSHFNHPFSSIFTSPNRTLLPQSITAYPPILIRSLRQLFETIYLRRALPPSSYASAGYSPRFVLFYGMPVETWSEFYALMTTKDISHLLPKNKNKGDGTDWETLKKISYLNWAHCVDDKVGYLNGKSEMDGAGRTVSMIWRKDMEGAWIQNAVKVYEEEVKRLGDVFKEKPHAREGLQWSLRKIIEKRFHTKTRVEAYWAKKGEGMPRELWMKRTVRMEEINEMKSVKSREDEDNTGVEGLLGMMEKLQVEAANASDPVEMTAEEAMIEAMEKINCGGDP